MTGRMGWQAAVMAAAMVVGVRAAAAQPAREPTDPDVTFSAEVTVTQAIVDRNGKTMRELPGSRYRLDRRDGGGVRLTMLATRSSPARGPLADVYAGMTVDTDPASGALRVRDAQGRRVGTPVAASLTAAPVEGDDGLVVTSIDRPRRLAALVERFGRPVGTVRALQRYLAKRDRVVEEVLVAPDTALPVELNRLQDGTLVEHHTFEYTPVGDGRLVRARSRSESAVPQGQGVRMVSLTTLTGIRVRGGGR